MCQLSKYLLWKEEADLIGELECDCIPHFGLVATILVDAEDKQRVDLVVLDMWKLESLLCIRFNE